MYKHIESYWTNLSENFNWNQMLLWSYMLFLKSTLLSKEPLRQALFYAQCHIDHGPKLIYHNDQEIIWDLFSTKNQISISPLRISNIQNIYSKEEIKDKKYIADHLEIEKSILTQMMLIGHC